MDPRLRNLIGKKSFFPYPHRDVTLLPPPPSLSLSYPSLLAPSTLWFPVLPADVWRLCDTKNSGDEWGLEERYIYTLSVFKEKRESSEVYCRSEKMGKRSPGWGIIHYQERKQIIKRKHLYQLRKNLFSEFINIAQISPREHLQFSILFHKSVKLGKK